MVGSYVDNKARLMWEMGYLTVLHEGWAQKSGIGMPRILMHFVNDKCMEGGTVASEKDGFMSETIIYHRNLPNPYLCEPLFCTRA